MLSRFSRLGAGQCMKPIYLFTLITLTIALIFTTLILTGSSTSSPGLRKFYGISLSYNTDNASSILKDFSSILDDDEGNTIFATVRAGYRGMCVENDNGDWVCHGNSEEFGDFGGDPLSLLNVAQVYIDKISFALPLWVGLALEAIAWLMVVPNMIPAIPMPFMTRKIAAGASSLGSLILLGAMVLQQITSGAVETLVNQLGLDAVVIHVGTANIAFGWACFALSFLGAVGCVAVAAAEWGMDRAQTQARMWADKGLEKGTGGRVNINDLENFGSLRRSGSSSNGGFSRGGTLREPKKTGISLASKLMNVKRHA